MVGVNVIFRRRQNVLGEVSDDDDKEENNFFFGPFTPNPPNTDSYGMHSIIKVSRYTRKFKITKFQISTEAGANAASNIRVGGSFAMFGLRYVDSTGAPINWSTLNPALPDTTLFLQPPGPGLICSDGARAYTSELTSIFTSNGIVPVGYNFCDQAYVIPFDYFGFNDIGTNFFVANLTSPIELRFFNQFPFDIELKLQVYFYTNPLTSKVLSLSQDVYSLFGTMFIV